MFTIKCSLEKTLLKQDDSIHGHTLLHPALQWASHGLTPFPYSVPQGQSNWRGYAAPACPLQLQLKGSSKVSLLLSSQTLLLQEGPLLMAWSCCLLLRGTCPSSPHLMHRYVSTYSQKCRTSPRGERSSVQLGPRRPTHQGTPRLHLCLCSEQKVGPDNPCGPSNCSELDSICCCCSGCRCLTPLSPAFQPKRLLASSSSSSTTGSLKPRALPCGISWCPTLQAQELN